MAHNVDAKTLIIERDCYVDMYRLILEGAKMYLKKEAGASIHVSGNPGIGKSQFYLYCILRLILEEKEFLSKYELIINFKNDYFIYESDQFKHLNTEDVNR